MMSTLSYVVTGSMQLCWCCLRPVVLWRCGGMRNYYSTAAGIVTTGTRSNMSANTQHTMLQKSKW